MYDRKYDTRLAAIDHGLTGPVRAVLREGGGDIRAKPDLSAHGSLNGDADGLYGDGGHGGQTLATATAQELQQVLDHKVETFSSVV